MPLSCCASTRSPKSRRSTAPPRCCHCCPAPPSRRTHDYRRNGTTNLYAALDVASGNVITDLTPRHRAAEFRKFLTLIDRSVPADLAVHVIVDNSSTHKTPGDPTLARPSPRGSPCTSHRPTARGSISSSAGSPNSPRKWLRRGTHRSVRDLVASIRTWIERWNDDPQPFVWHKTADEILNTLAEYCTRSPNSGH